jgi:pimeloyl-ACP methyl ester carboxylesterase
VSSTPDTVAGIELGTLDVAGASVAVLSLGSGEPVVYLHGLCDIFGALPGDAPGAFLEGLAASGPGRRVLAPALPGYPGGIGFGEVADVEDVVWHLVDVLGALALDRVDVVGHSIGGWYGAELALRHPGLVRRLVLAAPLGIHVSGVVVEPFFGAVAPRGIGGLGEARRCLFAAPGGQAAFAALPDDMGPEHELRWYAGLAGAARLGWQAPHFQSRALTRRLARIGVPTLVVRGSEDRLVPAEYASAWADGIPGATSVDVPGAGHGIAVEQPAALTAAVSAFLGWPS